MTDDERREKIASYLTDLLWFNRHKVDNTLRQAFLMLVIPVGVGGYDVFDLRKFIKDKITEAELLKEKEDKHCNLCTDKTYIQKYSGKAHLDFLARNFDGLSINKVHPKSENYPYNLCMFSIVTQHIYADNLNQLFDLAIDIENKVTKQEEQK